MDSRKMQHFIDVVNDAGIPHNRVVKLFGELLQVSGNDQSVAQEAVSAIRDRRPNAMSLLTKQFPHYE